MNGTTESQVTIQPLAALTFEICTHPTDVALATGEWLTAWPAWGLQC